MSFTLAHGTGEVPGVGHQVVAEELDRRGFRMNIEGQQGAGVYVTLNAGFPSAGQGLFLQPGDELDFPGLAPGSDYATGAFLFPLKIRTSLASVGVDPDGPVPRFFYTEMVDVP